MTPSPHTRRQVQSDRDREAHKAVEISAASSSHFLCFSERACHGITIARGFDEAIATLPEVLQFEPGFIPGQSHLISLGGVTEKI